VSSAPATASAASVTAFNLLTEYSIQPRRLRRRSQHSASDGILLSCRTLRGWRGRMTVTVALALVSLFTEMSTELKSCGIVVGCRTPLALGGLSWGQTGFVRHELGTDGTEGC
jgi:hypothetical protein